MRSLIALRSGRPPFQQRDLVHLENDFVVLIDHVIAEHHDAAARDRPTASFSTTSTSVRMVSPGRTGFKNLPRSTASSAEHRVGEQPPGHGGRERHGEMAWADAAAIRRSLRVVLVEEQRHVVAD